VNEYVNLSIKITNNSATCRLAIGIRLRLCGTAYSWAVIGQPDSTTYLSFQSEPAYGRPVWPATDGNQQKMTYLDIEADDLPAAVADAIDLGATAGPPAGPLCLCPVQRWSRTCSCKRAVTMSRTPAA
jgi:hypothetical protein